MSQSDVEDEEDATDAPRDESKMQKAEEELKKYENESSIAKVVIQNLEDVISFDRHFLLRIICLITTLTSGPNEKGKSSITLGSQIGISNSVREKIATF